MIFLPIAELFAGSVSPFTVTISLAVVIDLTTHTVKISPSGTLMWGPLLSDEGISTFTWYFSSEAEPK